MELLGRVMLVERLPMMVIMVTQQVAVVVLERLGKQVFRAGKVELAFLHQSLVQQW
jgi:hypothetical protein